ncbi:hypothetical protein SNN58_004590 [Cronobacter dublinensis]|nr:hypothetical protein [Cronobacter dublinensis]ELY3973265.1 hypothetical protein [Cronobacter dublinensis]ELY4484592.1 hypothetical protein [Cronobacter dublinensis]ELY5825968.1 hypothetical protein [Cronobacter dublinensis]
MKTKYAFLGLAIMGAIVFFHEDAKTDDELISFTYDYGREALRARLKDPNSLKTRNLTFRGHRTKDGGMAGAVCGEYNAKNSYGGYNGFAHFVAQVKVDNKGNFASSGGVYFPTSMFDLICKVHASSYYSS